MGQGLALLLVLALGLLPPGRGQPLLVEPTKPVVVVAMGGSCQLTCSLSCKDGEVATVQWRGLDTRLGAVQSSAGNSVLSIHQAALSDTGTRVCVGSCGGRHNFQHSVQILVYAFPDQLVVSPTALVLGQDQEVSCTAHNVTPAGQDTLSFTLLLGDQELEGVQVLGRKEEEEPQEVEDPLFQVTKRWLLPALGSPAPPVLFCQATMRLPGLEMSHYRALPVLHSQTSPKPPNVTSPDTPNAISMESPDAVSMEPPNTTSQEPPNMTSPDTLNAISTEPPNTTSLLATMQQSSTHNPRILSTSGTCHPEIHQAPGPAEKETGWELLCEAPCGPGMAVRWTLAPGGLEAYERREAGAQAWLSVPPDGLIPEGWFQCRLDPGGQVASLYVPGQVFLKTSSSPEVVQPTAALWMGSLVLGLLLLALLTYSLWKRWRPSAEDHTHLPTPLRLLPLTD
ncbi:mucosal addressin cell adhesion molecule 1 isoform X2 [Castor canadensis]|uniref:Mucosal addressin cell adhesion molecule 1 isoform X2 n=1 Tax=Castor canadensis TaxID=51338 RepID=A0AC58L094_CASCN